MKYRFENKVLEFCYDFCLVDVQSLTAYFANAPSKLFSEGNSGKPKKETGNLYRFHMNSYNVRINMYKFIYIWIQITYEFI
jgi:hypothetical protein